MYGGVASAVAIGTLLPLQALINARLGALSHGPLYASFVSFLVGTVLLLAMLLLARVPLLPAQSLGAFPPWVWLGGIIGALFVFSATLLVPKLGAGSMICLVVLGQVVGSLALDHYGVLGERRPADLLRLAGAVLVIVGAALVVRPWQGQ